MRPFTDFIETCKELAKMSSDKARTALIAAELSKCLPEERKVWLKLLLISEAPPPSGRPIMEKIISSVAGIDEDALKAKAEQAGHGSLVIEEMWPKNMARSHPVAVDEVLSLYENGGLDGALAGMSGKEVAWVWRVVDRRLFARIGARVVLNALHKDAFSAYKHAGSLTEILDRFCAPPAPVTDTYDTAASSSRAADSISLFTPVKPMLASPSRSIEDLGEQLTRLVRRNGGGTSDPISLQVEDKYDGERVQIHYNPDSGKPAMAFSRNLKPLVPTKFNAVRDVLPAAFPGVKSLIVDGEVLVIDKSTGEPLPFGTLGVHKFAALPSTASVCVVVFDILLLDGEPLLNKPLSVRRDVLSRVLKRVPHRVELANARVATNWGAVEAELDNAIERGIEGLVVKERTLQYRPDARHWWKLKKDYLDGMADTVDLLLLGAYQGTGARGGQLASFLMGCLTKPATTLAEARAPGAWKTVCRVGSGLSAAQLAQLQAPLRSVMTKATDAPPEWLSVSSLHVPAFYVTDPLKAPVWELAGTAVLPSPQHTSGYSLRFPRFQRERPDKDWAMHTALPALKSLVVPPRRGYATATATSKPRAPTSCRAVGVATRCRRLV